MSVDKLYTKSLIGLLRPAQIVTIAALFVTLVTGAFGFGFWAGETKEATSHSITMIELSRAANDLAGAESKIEELNASVDTKHKDAAFMQTKIRFLAILTLWY